MHPEPPPPPEELDREFKRAVVAIAGDKELRDAIITLAKSMPEITMTINNAVERLRQAVLNFE